MTKIRETRRFLTFILVAMLISLCLAGCDGELPELPELPNNQTEASTENAEHIAAYKQYVKSVLDANYHGDYVKYMEITGASAEQASRINDAHSVNLAEQLAELYAIQLEKLPAEIGDRLIALSKVVYRHSKYSVLSVEMTQKAVYVTVGVEPLKFLEDVSASVAEYTADFNDRAKAGEFENMTESQYENEYAEGILIVLEAAAENVEHADQVEYRITIQRDENNVNYIADSDLDAINHLILAD